MRENIIQLKLPVDEVVEKLNAVVRTRVNFIDQWGKIMRFDFQVFYLNNFV